MTSQVCRFSFHGPLQRLVFLAPGERREGERLAEARCGVQNPWQG